MSYAIIHKDPADWRVPPRLGPDFDREGFSWEVARSWLDGLPDGGLNIAHEAVDRHAAGPRSEHVAIRWLGKHGEREDLSYAELARRTNRFADVLDGLGLRHGRGRLQPVRPGARALRRRARHPQGRLRVLPAVLRVRARADPPAPGDR